MDGDTKMDPETLLRPREAAELCGVTVRALEDWRSRERGPVFVRISTTCIRYKRRDVIAWADSLRRSSNGDLLQGGPRDAA